LALASRNVVVIVVKVAGSVVDQSGRSSITTTINCRRSCFYVCVFRFKSFSFFLFVCVITLLEQCWFQRKATTNSSTQAAHLARDNNDASTTSCRCGFCRAAGGWRRPCDDSGTRGGWALWLCRTSG